jgi:sec-independent protein translocase protein TatC
MPDLKGYMNLTLKLLIIFGFIFELPLAVFYLGKAGIINHRMLSTKRRYAILGIFILSAIITPPDISSQILIALPMWGLYELSIIITKFFGKKVPVDERV